jgi:FixJ family two-component response regulator
LLGDNALSIDVIICDVRIPGMSGDEAVACFQREYPITPVIVLTGFPDVALAVDFMKKQDVVDYLIKPVEKDKLIAAVEQAAQGRKLFG